MNLYDEFHPLAVEMLVEFGADATLTRAAPLTPTLAEKRAGRIPTVQSPQNAPVRAVVAPLVIKGVDGRTETQTVATMLVEPREGDKLTMGASSWIVGRVSRVAPQGQAIVFMAEVA